MPGVTALDPEAVPEGSPRILAGFLISYDVQPLGRAWPIFQGTNRIGRQGAGVPLDLELDHPTASSRHAVILASACPGRMKLEDTGTIAIDDGSGAAPVSAIFNPRGGSEATGGAYPTIRLSNNLGDARLVLVNSTGRVSVQ